MPNKEVPNDYDYKIQGKNTEPRINVLEIMKQKPPEYVCYEYQSALYDEVARSSAKEIYSKNGKLY